MAGVKMREARKADKLLTIYEAAEYLDIHPMTLYRWVRKGKMPAAKLGKNWRFKRVMLEAWVDKHIKGK
jgi:excisionase family DNA binding protein